MSVLKVYYKIMKSHWLTLMIYMSIFFTVFFVFGMSASERSDIKMYEGSKPNIAVLDRDGSSLSEGLLTYLGTQANIKHKNVSNSDAQDALFYADVSAIITIPEGFEEEFASGKEAVSMNQRPDDVNGVLLQQTINKYLDTMHAYEKLYPKQGISELHTRVQKNLNTTAEVKMSDSEEVATSSMLRGAYFNYASYIMLVITILLIGLTMHSFFNAEITKRNLIAPVSQNRMNLQLVFCNLSVGIALWGLMMLMILGMVWDSMMTLGGLLEIVNAFVFMLMCVSMSFMFCVISAKSKQPDDMLNGISNIVGLGSSFLCGAFVPLSMIGENILVISRFLPSYWYVKLNDSLTSAVHVGDALLQEAFMTYGILLLFAAAFLCIALVIMKSRRTQDALEDTSMQP